MPAKGWYQLSVGDAVSVVDDACSDGLRSFDHFRSNDSMTNIEK